MNELVVAATMCGSHRSNWSWSSMSGIMFYSDFFDDAFLERPFGSIFGPGNIFLFRYYF